MASLWYSMVLVFDAVRCDFDGDEPAPDAMFWCVQRRRGGQDVSRLRFGGEEEGRRKEGCGWEWDEGRGRGG